MMYGGTLPNASGETQTWFLGTPPGTRSYGTGCAGSNGIPVLTTYGQPSIGTWAKLFGQAAIADPVGALGLVALSGGLELTIGT